MKSNTQIIFALIQESFSALKFKRQNKMMQMFAGQWNILSDKSHYNPLLTSPCSETSFIKHHTQGNNPKIACNI
jgi:hypothetical protein